MRENLHINLVIRDLMNGAKGIFINGVLYICVLPNILNLTMMLARLGFVFELHKSHFP